jgi:phosphomannomutase
MDRVLALATKERAVLACANDPDADRFAVAVQTPSGYRQLTGNEVGVLLGWDRLRDAQPNDFVATTIVSSRLLGVMARARGAGYVETLTGFKWIANAALAREAQHGGRFLFGYEEALGYTIGTLVRDKDGISALVAFAELCAWLAEQNETVFDLLARIYREHGVYATTQRTLALDAKAPPIGDRLRREPPKQIGGRAITSVEDLQTSTRVSADGRREALTLPRSDVLVYHLEDDARVIVRPSGTEPKLKCYYEVREPMSASEDLATAEARANRVLETLALAHQSDL